MMEEKLKHLEFIQKTIDRMAKSSFLYKNWMIAILSAILAAYATTLNKGVLLVGLVPILAFWALDSFHLVSERKYRKLYQTAANEEISISSMRISQIEFQEYIKGFLSFTLLILYLPSSLIVLFLYFCSC